MADPVTYEAAKNVMSAVESGAVSAALVVGGIWGLIRWKKQLMSRRAQAELSELENRISREPVLSVSLSFDQPKVRDLRGHPVIIHVLVKNVGSCDASIKLSDPPLTIVKSRFTDTGAMAFDPPVGCDLHAAHKPGYRVSDIEIGPGLEEGYSFAALLPDPGMYLVTFHTPIQEETLAQLAPGRWWGNSRFLVVQ